MNIVVCIKQVPDTNEVRIDPATGTLVRDGIPTIINPDDLSALEEALKTKEELGAHVLVMTMGPPQAEYALREALAMGADEAVLLTDRQFSGADTLATSRVLAAAVRKLGYAVDIIFAGRQAIDGDTAQVGPEMAEHLGLPQVTYVEGMKVHGGRLVVKRSLEDGYECISVKMPVVLTTIKELNEPRYMGIKGISDAFGKEIRQWVAGDIGLDPALLGLNGSPTRVKKSMTKELRQVGQPYEAPAKEAAGYVAGVLKELHIL